MALWLAFVQLLRFGVVGVMATAVHFFVLNALVSLPSVGPVQSNGVAFCCAVGVTYTGQSRWVFGRRPFSAQRFRRFMVSAVGGLFLLNKFWVFG